MHKKTYQLVCLLLWIGVAVLGRVIPHLPNMTPFVSLSLLCASVYSKRSALWVMLVAAVISDAFISLVYGYPLFGYWTIFTYSGFLMMVLLGSRLANHLTVLRALIYTLAGTVGFWLWTNFGVWVVAGMYPKTAAGLMTSYAVALPFLQNALIGSCLWMLILLGSVYFFSKKMRLTSA